MSNGCPVSLDILSPLPIIAISTYSIQLGGTSFLLFFTNHIFCSNLRNLSICILGQAYSITLSPHLLNFNFIENPIFKLLKLI